MSPWRGELVQSSITATKTVRDVHESGKPVDQIEDAKSKRLLMGMECDKA